MKPSEGLQLERLVQSKWGEFAIAPDVLAGYKADLGHLDGAEVLAAVETLAADGAKLPNSGTIKRRVAELAVGVLPWGTVRSALLAWRAACSRHAAERDEIKRNWKCPFGICDGDGWEWVDDNSTADCRCRPQLLAELRSTDVLPPVLERFVAERHTSPMELDQMVNDTTLEAQVRDRWNDYASGLVRDAAYAGIPNPAGLPALEAARVRHELRGPKPMGNAIAAAGLQLVEQSGEAA